MKRLFILCGLLLFAGAVPAQKVINDPNAELRSAASFQGIAVSGGIDVFLSAGKEVVVVSAVKPEYRDQIRTEVQNGILKIWYENKRGLDLSGSKGLRAYVSYSTLKSIEAVGGSDVLVDGRIATDELVLRLAGGSDFKGKVQVNKLTVKQSGGSDVKISGKAATVQVDASGGSDFSGYDLLAEVCELEASGASDIEITATVEVAARASGASDIQYKGNPGIKSAKASGASSVKAKL